MSRPFRFKQFTIKQDVNPQKVGADSMLLGAWIKGDYQRILDIGTGTGILALMLAQKNPQAQITAIEPDFLSLEEAQENFQQSPFKQRIMGVHAPLQQFGSLEKFNLIISNPPYFENAFLSPDNDRNRARHTADLPVNELYECAADLLAEDGFLALIIPFEAEKEHLQRAWEEDLYPAEIMRTVREDGSFKRSLILFTFEEKSPKLSEICVKNSQNQYDEAYIELTQDFYFNDLRAQKH